MLDIADVSVPEDFQGRSLLPILDGTVDPGYNRSFVRSEYFDAVSNDTQDYATMYRNDRYKLVLYHSHGKGELYDLVMDPWEFENLWDDPDHKDLTKPPVPGGLQRHHDPGHRPGRHPDRRHVTAPGCRALIEPAPEDTG